MSDPSKIMEVDDGVVTPSASQERMLLGEDKTEPETTNAQTGVPSMVPTPPINLAGLKQQIETNAKIGVPELSMSLQTGTVTVTKPNRSRSKSRKNRSRSKRKPTASVNPHDRVKNDIASETPKRGREAGGTPPSANQPSKKPIVVSDSTAAGNNTQQVLSKRQKARLKATQKREALKQNAVNTTVIEMPVPPPAPGLESSGAGKSITVVDQQNAGNTTEIEMQVPPPAPGLESSGAGKSINEVDQQNAASSSSTGGEAVNPQNQLPAVDDKGETPLSYAQVADNHCVAIIDQRQPGTLQLLDQQRYNKINSLLTDMIMAMIGSNSELPVFDDTRPHGGTMRVRCANPYTRKWLETNVPKLDAKKLWPGAKLVVIDFKDVPKPHKFNVFFRGILKSSQDILRLLETQNKGITTKSWSVLHCGQRDGGTHMTIGVGQDSFETLKRQSNSLYCGMGKAVFTAVKGCKTNRAMTQAASVVNTTVATPAVDQRDSDRMQVDGEHTKPAASELSQTGTQQTGTEE